MSDKSRSEWTDRAPRKRVLKFARLRWPGAEDVVSLKDISRSGVRLLVPRESQGRLSDALYQLEVSLGVRSALRVLQVSLARVCGHDDKHMDLAFRFVAESLTDEELANLTNLFFGE